jgi:hypothetical protein
VGVIPVRWINCTFAVKFKWSKTQQLPPFNSSSTEPSFVRIISAYHAGSFVIDSLDRDLYMYRRESYEQQIRFLRDDVLSGSSLGWIIGPPGTGKSCTTFSFLLSLDREEWETIWIHLDQMQFPEIVMFRGDEKLCTRCAPEMVEKLLEHCSSTTRKQVLVIDGFVTEATGHATVVAVAYSWKDDDIANRRVAIICSMASRGKCSMTSDALNSVKEFMVYSWTLEEYYAAVAFTPFFQSVKASLDAMEPYENPNPTVQEMVEAKFRYAGGSVRFMFSTTTEIVRQQLTISMDAYEGNRNPFAVGQRGAGLINRLFSIYKGDTRDEKHVVSLYVAKGIALRVGPDAMKALVRSIKSTLSGSTNGGLFESIFFSRLASNDLSLKCPINSSNIIFKKEEISEVNMGSPSIHAAPISWMKPLSEISIGFDAVFVDVDARMARFVQVARGVSHSFKLQGASTFLSKIDCKIEIVEFCFVIREDLLGKFKIEKDITGQGAFAGMKIAGKEEFWQSNEEQEHIVRLGMADIL